MVSLAYLISIFYVGYIHLMRITFLSICIYILCPILVFLLNWRKPVVENVVEWKVMDPCEAKLNNIAFLWNNSSLWMFFVPALLFKLDHILNEGRVELYTGSALLQNCSRHEPNLASNGIGSMTSFPNGKTVKYGRTSLFSSFSELKNTQNKSFADSASPSAIVPSHSVLHIPENGSILLHTPTNSSLKKMPSTFDMVMPNM